jgi:hypothetical protein
MPPLRISSTHFLQRKFNDIPHRETFLEGGDSLDWLRPCMKNLHEVSFLQGDGIDVICREVLRRYEYIIHLQRKDEPFGTSFIFSFQHNMAIKHSEFQGDTLNRCV